MDTLAGEGVVSNFSYVNPYGTLGPSPGRVATINRLRKTAPTKPKAPPASYLSGVPSVLSDTQARDQVMALLAPIFQQQQQAVNSGYDQRAASIRAAYDQLARYSQGVAPAVQGAYTTAARDTAAFGKGFSDAVSQASQGQASAATGAIAAQGGPQTVTSGLANGGGDALYAMGGAIPGTALEQAGAAFGSAASFLPATAAGYGAQAVSESEAQRIADLQGITADQPKTVLDMMNQLVDRSYGRRQDALKFAVDQRDYNDTKQAAAAKAKQDMIDRQWEAATLKQAYGYKLTPREKKLLATYGTTPSAVEAAGKAKVAAQDDARTAAMQRARDKATAARQAAADARKASLEARKAAARSGLEKDKARYRKALEAYKAAQRKALQTQKDASAMARKKTPTPKSKSSTSTGSGNPADGYFGG